MRSEGRGRWAGLLGVLACAGACARNTSAGDAGDAGAGVVGDGAAGDGVSGDGVSPADGEGLPLGAEVLTPREPNRIPICSPDNVCWFTPEHGLSNPAILGTVLALAENDVWMAHLHGSVQHWDGRTRTTVFAEGDGLGAINAMWGSGPNDLWLMGYRATHWNGRRWISYAWPDGRTHSAVWGSGPNDVWALPSGTTSIDHWDGTQWSSMELPTSAAMYGLAGWSATSVWVVGEEGAVLRWDGARWNEIPRLEGVADWLQSVGALSEQSIEVVENNRAHRWTGSAWEDAGAASANAAPYWDRRGARWNYGYSSGGIDRTVDGVAQTFPAASVQGAPVLGGETGDRPWLLDEASNLFAPTSTGWDLRGTRFPAYALSGVSMDPDGELWAVTSESRQVLERCPSSQWCEEAVIDEDRVRPLGETWTSPEGGRWIVAGTSSGPGLFQGSRRGGWRRVATARTTSVLPSAIHGTSDRDVWVAFYDGVVGHWDGTNWTTTAVAAERVAALWASSLSDVWAGTLHGSTMHWDGARWNVVEANTGREVYAFWGSSARDVWMGRSGNAATCAVRHWDGSRWSDPPSCPMVNFGGASIGGTSPTDVWVGGRSGALAHWDGARWSTLGAGTLADITRVMPRPDGVVYLFTSMNALLIRRP